MNKIIATNEANDMAENATSLAEFILRYCAMSIFLRIIQFIQ